MRVVAILLVFSLVVLCCCERDESDYGPITFEKVISLENLWSLKVVGTKEKLCVLELRSGEQAQILVKAMVFGDAEIRGDLIERKPIRGRKSGGLQNEVFLTLPSLASSTGAGRHVVVWKDVAGWRMRELPFDVAVLKDQDGDGMYEIVTYPKEGGEQVFQFQGGRCVPWESQP